MSLMYQKNTFDRYYYIVNLLLENFGENAFIRSRNFCSVFMTPKSMKNASIHEDRF